MDEIARQIEAVVDSILQDYGQGRDIDRLDMGRHPDREIVIDMIEKLRRIVFPGYFTQEAFRIYSARHNLSILIEDVMFRLGQQLELIYQGLGQPSAKATAQQTSLAFFRTIPAIREYVQGDLQAAYDGDPAAANKDEIIYSYPGLFAITVYRLAHSLHTLEVPMLPRIMTEYAHSVTGIDIHPGAVIGKNFFIDHGTGVVIGETTVIGDCVKMYQGVTLGGLSTKGGQRLRGKKRHPTIEDNVTIYAGASILGGDTVIGKGSVIGANTFITHSIAPGTTVTLKNQELQFKSKDTGDFWNC